ncbi:GNAT family N-acetyltransferase [Clostridium sp. D2Q-14]|uniref:GNAT family N-acetyltransferase n=1 Tax=Anaeromonas gelatinilytica TaxID=2683194 RepID=UPI00193C57B9|nr:GNAT family N-acetyltransferase [Anaeromonas gelatinilytica]MBS4536578.1 GNAT family N-acetyltransferase [Anaeromonas gelatinilytica]
MKIRRARKEDIDDISKLWKKLSDCHAEFIDYMSLSAEWQKNLLEMFYNDINSKNSIIFVGEINNKIIGFIRGEIKEINGIFASNKIVFITDIFMEELFRGKGLTKNLIEKIEEYCREKEIFNIKLNVNTQNKRAIGFYKKKGFIEVNRTYKKDLNV